MIWLQWAVVAVVGVGVVAVGALAVAVAFGTSPAPEEMKSVSETMRQVDYGGLPPLSYFTARDGASLSYRAYPRDGNRVAVLIHGSSGESTGMHALARGTAAAGFSVYVPELRGHGMDGRLGDIDYVGQLDDDLADLMQVVRREHPQGVVDLVGHSSGGGFALRIAEGPATDMFSRYVLLAPALHFGAPTWRPGAGGWARPFVPRIVGLTVLDRLGVTRFEHLPVVAFAVPAQAPVRLARTYSFVLQRNFSAPSLVVERLSRVRAPMVLLVGEEDEIFYADRFAPLLCPRRPDMRVQILPGIDHMGLVTRDDAVASIVAAMK